MDVSLHPLDYQPSDRTIMSMYFLSVLLYSADVWSLTVASQRRLDAFNQWRLLHILSIPYTAICQ